MHLPHKQSDQLTDLGTQLLELTERLVDDLKPIAQIITLPSSPDVFAGQAPERVFQIAKGQVYYRSGAKLVARFEPGDLIGLSRGLNFASGTYGSEGPVALTPFDFAQFEQRAMQSRSALQLWTRYLLCLSSFYREALAQEIRAEFEPSAGFMHFRAGETIIEQGTEADRVYTLLEGRAEALRDEIKVGEIQENEIFGALAVFTRQKRMASVVATTDCTVLALRKEEFIDLIDIQPQICLGLIEEMAAKINQLNGQLLSLKTEQA